jgi:hypothetical protein
MAAERQRKCADDHDEQLQHALIVAGVGAKNQPGRILASLKLLINTGLSRKRLGHGWLDQAMFVPAR